MRKFKVGDCIVSIDNINAFYIKAGDMFIVKNIGENNIGYYLTINNVGDDIFLFEDRFKLDIKCERKRKLEKIYTDNQVVNK